MTLGSVWPNGAQVVITAGKSNSAAITKGALTVRDTATTPDSWKIAPTGGSQLGPFGACVNQDAATAATAFAMALPGTIVTMKAQGAIEPGAPVYASTTVAGSISATVSGDAAGRYIGHENEVDGKTPATAAADGETNVLVRLGGAF